MTVAEVLEMLDQIQHRIEIARVLVSAGRDDLLPTPLEDIYGDAQTIFHDYCLEEG